MNIVGSKWVFCIKRKADGGVEHYKAHHVTKGFHQQLGIDFGETVSPVIKPVTICIVLPLVVSSGWQIKKIEISSMLFFMDFLLK